MSDLSAYLFSLALFSLVQLVGIELPNILFCAVCYGVVKIMMTLFGRRIIIGAGYLLSMFTHCE